jgi:hypothetical protein
VDNWRSAAVVQSPPEPRTSHRRGRRGDNMVGQQRQYQLSLPQTQRDSERALAGRLQGQALTQSLRLAGAARATQAQEGHSPHRAMYPTPQAHHPRTHNERGRLLLAQYQWHACIALLHYALLAKSRAGGASPPHLLFRTFTRSTVGGTHTHNTNAPSAARVPAQTKSGKRGAQRLRQVYPGQPCAIPAAPRTGPQWWDV